MDRSRQVIGIVLIVISIIVMIGWEKWGREHFLTKEILVLSRDVKKGETVDRDMLRVQRQDRIRKEWLRPADREELVGKEAAMDLHRDVPLFEDNFLEAGLTADPELDRYVVSLPEQWMQAYPYGIRRGDQACFYLGEKFLMDAPVRAADPESRVLSVILSGKQAGIIGGLVAEENRFIITYHE